MVSEDFEQAEELTSLRLFLECCSLLSAGWMVGGWREDKGLHLIENQFRIKQRPKRRTPPWCGLERWLREAPMFKSERQQLNQHRERKRLTRTRTRTERPTSQYGRWSWWTALIGQSHECRINFNAASAVDVHGLHEKISGSCWGVESKQEHESMYRTVPWLPVACGKGKNELTFPN